MKLPPETQLHPGHTDPTTVGDEWEQNAFIRVWRGLDEEGCDHCTVWEREATLVLWGPTTTAGTRPGSAGGTPGRTTSSPAPRSYAGPRRYCRRRATGPGRQRA